MGIKDKFDQELEMRKRYKRHVDEYGNFIYDNYSAFKRQTLKNDSIKENNIEVISQLNSFIGRIISNHGELREDLADIRNFISSNSRYYYLTYSVNSICEGDKNFYFFDAATTRYDDRKMIVDIITDSKGNVLSFQSIHLDFVHPGVKGLMEKGLSPSNRLTIEKLDTDNPCVTKERFWTNCFMVNEKSIEWEEVYSNSKPKVKKR